MIELMDRAVPPHEGTGDWGAVLRDAGTARRRARLRPALAFAVIAAALVIAWQAAAPSSTIDRALAAAGDGHVLHLVFEGSMPKRLVNLRTGERREMRGIHEVWFDPATGARERETFAGVLQWEALNATGHGREIYSSLGRATVTRCARGARRWSARRSRCTGSGSRPAITSRSRATPTARCRCGWATCPRRRS